MGKAAEPKLEDVPLDAIEIDGGTQMRDRIDEKTVAEYAEALQEGADLPPAVVFRDGRRNWLGDGFHRYHGSRKAGLGTLYCEVRKGTRRDAILFAAGANAEHGLKRSNADKRHAIVTLLADEEWGKASDRWIAQACRVSADLVGKVRSETGATVGNDSQPTRTGRDGRTINTANIGRKADPSPEPSADPQPWPGDAADEPEGDDAPEFRAPAEPQWAETDEDREPVLSESDWKNAEIDERRREAHKRAQASIGKAVRDVDSLAEACGLVRGTYGQSEQGYHGSAVNALNEALQCVNGMAGAV